MPPDILMPALSPTMEEGKLAKWHVKEGDSVKPGDVLAEIETDKATMEFEAVDEGKIEKLLVAEGAEGVKINVPIARLVTPEEGAAPKPAKAAEIPTTAAPSAPGGGAKSAPAATPQLRQAQSTQAAQEELPAQQKQPPKTGNGAIHSQPGHRIFASPLAKRLAQDHQIDI